jgi:hypothetical protein
MKTRLSILLAILVCSSGLLLAPDITHNLGAWRFSDIANVISSTLNNVAVVMFGSLVGTLLMCFFDPAAKEQISRGIKSAWKRPQRS